MHRQTMGAVEAAVDAAAQFVGPFVDKNQKQDQAGSSTQDVQVEQLVEQALSHLQAINDAEEAADPDSPYDASLAGVVYGLLDLITSYGIIPYLSPGVAFSQRPRSVLTTAISVSFKQNEVLLSKVIKTLVPILEQNGTGVQPLLSQRILPDILSAVAELSLSPHVSEETHATFRSVFEGLLSTTPTSRLLIFLSAYLQQDPPTWLKPKLSQEMAAVPLRPHGVRHIVEFLSLSYMSKNTSVPQDASGTESQLPIPIEAITQASRLLVSPPSGVNLDQWLHQLAPQLLDLLDEKEGKELSRAAGQIIAGGILNKKSTGAPGTAGWELFARSLLENICPPDVAKSTSRQSTSDKVLVKDHDLLLALSRLATISSSYSHTGLTKRIIGPILLPLWGLINYAKPRASLNKQWTELPRSILARYISLACDPKQIDNIAINLFWDGQSSWTFGPGSHGGVEIRERRQAQTQTADMGSILTRISNLDERIGLLVSLLVDANVADEVATAIFLQISKRWLSPAQDLTKSLTIDSGIDPLVALTNAKLSEALATRFKNKFARSPQHIVELMGQILQNFVNEHQNKSKIRKNTKKPSRANLGNLLSSQSTTNDDESDTESEELVSFALSILTNVITSSDFKKGPQTDSLFVSILPILHYLTHPPQTALPLQSQVVNAATHLLQTLEPTSSDGNSIDPLASHRQTLKTVLTDITSPEPPDRRWALTTLRQLIQDPTSFPLIDIPSTAHMLLSASLSDPEPFVHNAAIPTLVDLATRAPNPTTRIIVDAFLDTDEHSLHLRKTKEIEQALDFRLRVGEALNSFASADDFWLSRSATPTRYANLKMLVEATLSLASRRGQRHKTLSARTTLEEEERRRDEEAEAAWSGPIPNLLDPEAEDPVAQAERDALLKIVQGWEDTGVEEDVRVRASALSILGTVFEKRLGLLNQVVVDAGLQIVLLVLMMEREERSGILRRAAVLVVMGLLRGMDAALEHSRGEENVQQVGLGGKAMEEVERVVTWVRDEDCDELVRDHAESVVEGLGTWRMKQLYRLRGGGEETRLGKDLGLEGRIRGLDVKPEVDEERKDSGRMIIEEID